MQPCTFALDFGSYSVEKEETGRGAQHLGVEHHLVRVRGHELRRSLRDLNAAALHALCA